MEVVSVNSAPVIEVLTVLLYSHIWDAILKLLTLFALIMLAIWLKLDERLHSGALMVIIVAIVWGVLYRQFLSIFSSWLYARLSLHTRVSFGEAKALRKLFQLDVSGKWIPAKNIRTLPPDARHTALLQTLESPGLVRKALLF